MNLSSAKTVTFKNKDVKEISIGGSRVWKKAENQWDLASREQVVSPQSSYHTGNNSILSYLSAESYYFNSIQCTGVYWRNWDLNTVSNVTSTGFTLTNISGTYGIGVSYPVVSGQTITLGLTKNVNCMIYAVYYDTSGYRVSSNQLGNAGTNLTLTDTSSTDGWVMLVFAPYSANVTVTFSDIILSIA